MQDGMLASRQFRASDQQLFARISGDVNPMHMDSVAARRTQAGAAVVHGIHLLLWALDQLALSGASLAALASLQVRFKKFVFLDREVFLRRVTHSDDVIKLEILADGITCVTMTLKLRRHDAPAAVEHDVDDIITPSRPMVRSLEDIPGLRGWLAPCVGADRLVAEHFPNAVSQLGVERLLALAQLSTLVGMVCPGLHSIFSELAVRLGANVGTRAGIGFATADVDPRFRLVTMHVSGSGLAGEVTAFARAEPFEPPSMQEIATHVVANEFAGSVALIIGGSRGLGAVTAKLIAGGGGRVYVSYARGADEAQALQDDIRSARGTEACSILHLDVNDEPEAVIAAIPCQITHLYYFATPQIFRQKGEVYSASTFDEFASVYLEGFCRTVESLVARAPGQPLRVLCPSSVFVAKRPKGMTEYAMAKAAAELLSVDLAERYHGLRIDSPRLPRVRTDQTVSMMDMGVADSVETLLPLLRNLHAP